MHHLKIEKMQQTDLSKSSELVFSVGNPSVEEIKGRIHLYKNAPENPTFSSGSTAVEYEEPKKGVLPVILILYLSQILSESLGYFFTNFFYFLVDTNRIVMCVGSSISYFSF